MTSQLVVDDDFVTMVTPERPVKSRACYDFILLWARKGDSVHLYKLIYVLLLENNIRVLLSTILDYDVVR